MGAESERVAGFGKLEDGLRQAGEWYTWGPYVSERQWGTVREDYSASGDAWDYMTHDEARSYAYRWGEDGLAGFCDVEQRLCLGLALWNGRDPILKERAFGLTGSQGNHGEDVKEYWWYLDAIPSHAWNRWRYHYPQGAFPYQDLIDTNGGRDRYQPEYELLDTGAFDGNRYWIVEVHYAKAGPARRADGRSRSPTRDRTPKRCTCCRPPGSATPGRGSQESVKPAMAATSDRSVGIEHPFLGAARAARRATARTGPPRRSCSARTRRTPAAVRRGADHAVSQRRHQRPRGQRGGHRQPRAHRHQVRVLVQGHRAAGRDARAAAAAAAAGSDGRTRSAQRSTRCWRRARPRRTSSTPS